MTDNATILIIPQHGQSSNIITVLGDTMVYVERSIRAVMVLLCDFYIATIKRNFPPSSNNPNQISDFDKDQAFSFLIKSVCKNSGSDLFIYPSYIEIVGPFLKVKKSFDTLSTSDFYKTSRDAKFQLELALEHREFINGKKNGKINKITKTSNSRIVFIDTFNAYNMLIEISNINLLKLKEGLLYLEDELPSELSFHVAESFHKRIIGVGGKNIQRIMKKYGVYVKFSNALEFLSLGGYFENNDNVIARTPSKNSSNLKELKSSILELVSPIIETSVYKFKLDRFYHHLVIGHQASNIKRIEAATSTCIIIPERETGLDQIDISGTE